MHNRPVAHTGVVVLALILASEAQPTLAQDSAAGSDHATAADDRVNQLTKEVEELRELVSKLQGSIAQLKAQTAHTPLAPAAPASGSGTATSSSTATPAVASTTTTTAASTANASAQPNAPTVASSKSNNAVTDLLHGMTIDGMLDTYYEYNFNDPIGRVNYLRAYDVSANNFSINQADIVLESAPDLDTGKRIGVRVDLQFGQATETLQGNLANELRPEIWRNLFQAYGSYWVPINGEPLTLDFGKWASSLGIEGNYTKDQMNYSRSFWFNFLPFYHTGLRANYKVNDLLSLNFWVTNGTEQTEAFNNFKDVLGGFVLTPMKTLSWTFNYYVGEEHPDIAYVTNPIPGQQYPMQQGMPFLPIPNAPNGLLQIADSYMTWQASSALTLAAEADYVTERLYSYSLPQKVTGGALYVHYQWMPRLAVTLRGEYLADPEGLFSGLDQYLKEGTFTAEYAVTDGFLVFAEGRKDFSNRPYFLTDVLNRLAAGQPTLGLGLVWWMGQKPGAW